MIRRSLRLRLMVGFLLIGLLCWAAAAVGTGWQTRHSINQLFDTQQMLFAKRLASMDPKQLDSTPLTLPASKKMLRHHRGEQEDDSLAFAVFTRTGRMVLNDGDNGKDFPFSYARDGFTDGRLRDDDDPWRLVWLTTADGQFIVAVGQEWEYRDDMTRDLVRASLMPWLVSLPVMLLLMLWLVTRELSPLKGIARQLRHRTADDAAPLQQKRVPQEVQPLLDELNQLFSRTANVLVRERRFTSDAAHELRSPLAALKVQTEVAQLAHDDRALLERALANLDAGIDRATRLVDQLLTLSRLDSGQALESRTAEWQPLLQQAVVEHYAAAQEAGVELILSAPAAPQVIQGHPLLLALLVRNLVDNAIRYSPPGGEVQIRLEPVGLTVLDDGPGIDPALLSRVGERFYRPPGQSQSGSGLGLSIVHQIAHLHGFTVVVKNRESGGLAVTIRF